MKTPSFWYPHPPSIGAAAAAAVLTPLSWFFVAGAFTRRLFARPYKARVPVVCVGNVVAGGAGKTPTVLALARILKDRGQRPVFVTRGYGGHGELLYVDPAQHEAEEVGDEALLLAAQAPTWAGADRVAAVRQAESHATVILMDDGLQNPHVAPTASLLVVDGEVGIGNGHVMPAGPLRESLERAVKRAAAVIIIGDRDKQKIAGRVSAPVFRAHLKPVLPRHFPRASKFVAFAGIGRPEKFYATARAAKLHLAGTQDFPDHHLFTDADIQHLRLLAEEKGARLLTTAKDAARLPPDFQADVVVLPVTLVFHEEDAEERLAQICENAGFA